MYLTKREMDETCSESLLMAGFGISCAESSSSVGTVLVLIDSVTYGVILNQHKRKQKFIYNFNVELQYQISSKSVDHFPCKIVWSSKCFLTYVQRQQNTFSAVHIFINIPSVCRTRVTLTEKTKWSWNSNIRCWRSPNCIFCDAIRCNLYVLHFGINERQPDLRAQFGIWLQILLLDYCN
jgi:hypothetical protein